MRKPKIQHKSTSISRSQAQPACRLPPVNPIRLPGPYNSDRANQPQAAAPVHPPQQRSPKPARRDPVPNPEHPNPGGAAEMNAGVAWGGSSPGRAQSRLRFRRRRQRAKERRGESEVRGLGSRARGFRKGRQGLRCLWPRLFDELDCFSSVDCHVGVPCVQKW